MKDADQMLRSAGSVVLVDWPSKEVPETFARAGFTVFSKGGPEPDNYSAYELRDGAVVSRPTGGPPAHADLVYSYRPIREMPAVVAVARQVGATAVWYQSGLVNGGARDPRGCWMPEVASQEAREIVESAGLMYVEAPYIADAIRHLEIHK